MSSDVIVDHPHIGRSIHDLPTPTALVDLDVLDANIATMAAFFRDRPASLRPHAKTHRTPAVARLQIAAGARGITCAKVGMAEAMVAGGIELMSTWRIKWSPKRRSPGYAPSLGSPAWR